MCWVFTACVTISYSAGRTFRCCALARTGSLRPARPFLTPQAVLFVVVRSHTLGFYGLCDHFLLCRPYFSLLRDRVCWVFTACAVIFYSAGRTFRCWVLAYAGFLRPARPFLTPQAVLPHIVKRHDPCIWPWRLLSHSLSAYWIL